MAEENEDGQEKTEDPTPKRQRDAKEKGQVPRSRELTTTLIMLAAATSLIFLGPHMADSLAAVLERSFTVERAAAFDPGAPVRMLYDAIGEGLVAVLPFALIMFVVTVVAPVALGGWTFSGKALAPKLEKLSPLKGLKRIFGVGGLVELAKAVGKVLIVGAVGGMVFYNELDGFRALGGESLASGIRHASHMFFWTFMLLAASLILIALVDVPYQIWDHTKKLRMTKQEVKDE
ncbi:MAG: EscU/YscU/HrcU family type III secretion system export apparatus switch protein, partial [Ectothiorhodospiraceae bacterium]